MTAQRDIAEDLDDYLFDLRGYLILENAIEPDLVDALNGALDGVPQTLRPYEWWGNVQRSDTEGDAKGLELQNIVEGGEPFERLLDHPSWISRVRRYCGETESYVQGLFIDECFASIRRQGGYFGVHSGGYKGASRGQYRFKDGLFRCGQVNILMALTDIGPGDGGTMVIPGSHKSNLPHPQFEQFQTERMDTMPGVIEVHLKKGDALLFCDGLSHGASSRSNPGERRVVIYRYGPSWGATRHGYRYSAELIERLTPERRKILQPIAPRVPTAEPAPFR
ncbi:MAG TPA: phytanoyl-CoA dioxygenase family protein [Mycobacteriales bacterium]|jgi:ectoine hydroxylase-related dioxygenase (phytanoyl-CoA dioxygenase family)|nr:phytanoyl-CoA dioxygenase family protein [Mycobacteriales bacterium]